LKQVDRNGSSTASPAIAVKFGLTAESLKITAVSDNWINGSIALPHMQKGQILYTDMTGKCFTVFSKARTTLRSRLQACRERSLLSAIFPKPVKRVLN